MEHTTLSSSLLPLVYILAGSAVPKDICRASGCPPLSSQLICSSCVRRVPPLSRTLRCEELTVPRDELPEAPLSKEQQE